MAVRSRRTGAKAGKVPQQSPGEDKGVRAVFRVLFSSEFFVGYPFSQGARCLYGTMLPGQTFGICVGHYR